MQAAGRGCWLGAGPAVLRVRNRRLLTHLPDPVLLLTPWRASRLSATRQFATSTRNRSSLLGLSPLMQRGVLFRALR